MNNDLAELTSLLERFSTHEQMLIDAGNQQGDGAFDQRDRIHAAAEWACQKYSGDLVEIGCLNGSTTVRLAEVAQKYGRRVIAVDPWQVGTQNCNGGEHAIFLQTTEPFKDIIDVVRKDSRDPEVAQYLKQRQLCFAFVDGLHTFEATRGDILSVGHAPVIAVDDTRWSSEVLRAFHELHEERDVLSRSYWRESWMLFHKPIA